MSDSEGLYPIAITVTLPLQGAGHSALPVILLEDILTGEMVLDRITLNWAISMSHYKSFSTIRRRVKSLCRFMNFVGLFRPGKPQNINEQTALIFAYYDFRRNGTLEFTHGHPLAPLRWTPVSRNTVQNEFRDIVKFFRYLEQTGNPPALALSSGLRSLPESETLKLVAAGSPGGDMLSHLAEARQFWETVQPTSLIQMPTRGRLNAVVMMFRPFPPEEEVNAIIMGETNPAFRAIWTTLAYGASHRLSELLNVWQTDVLPSSYRREFFRIKNVDESPLVLIAHPSESTYLGHFRNRGSIDRRTYLRQEFGLTARNLLPSDHKLYAGFKTKRLHGAHKTANTFWLDNLAAHIFSECAEEIHRFHLHNRTSRWHPYFFVNMFSRDHTYGRPLKKNRVERAWEAACRRVGITPHDRGRNIQGLRHFNKFYADRLGLSPHHIQVMRGDASIHSQEDYGNCADAVFEAIHRVAGKKGIWGNEI